MKKYLKYWPVIPVVILGLIYLILKGNLDRPGIHTILNRYHHIDIETDVFDENNNSIHINIDCYGKETSDTVTLYKSNSMNVDGIDLEPQGSGIIRLKEQGLYEMFSLNLPQPDADGNLGHMYPYDDYFFYFDDMKVYVEIVHHMNSREVITLYYSGNYAENTTAEE